MKNFIMKDFTFVKYCTMKIKCKNVKFWTMKDFTLVNNFTMKKFTLVKYWIYETKNVRLWNISHMKTLPTVADENAFNVIFFTKIVNFFTYEYMLIWTTIHMKMKISYICEFLHNEKFTLVKNLTMKNLQLWNYSHMKKITIVKLFTYEKFTTVKSFTMKIECKNVKSFTYEQLFIYSYDNENQLHLWKITQWNKNVRMWNFSHMNDCSYIHMFIW